MIISKAPFRMSFVGGGTDFPSFYKNHGGAVLSSSIDKFIYILVKSRFEKGIRCSYSKTEIVDNVNDLEHGLVRNALLDLKIQDSLEIVSSADIPSSGSGLGSSSTFSVALYNALLNYLDREVSSQILAESACKLEIELSGSPIGKQDQYASAYGGMNVYEFHTNDTVSVHPVNLSNDFHKELNDSILSFYIGGDRSSNDILKEQDDNVKKNHNLTTLKKMVKLVWDLKNEMENKEISNFGEILNENWNLKKTLSNNISNDAINQIYDEAISCGATGGKLLGAGGGGFMIFITRNEDVRSKLRNNFSKLREVKLNLTDDRAGIIYKDIK